MAIKSSDQITVVDLTDGYSVNLTNDSFTFAGDKDGKIATQQSTTTVIQALRGDEVPTITVNNSDITKPSGVTTSWSANTNTLTITVAASVTSGGVVTIPVVLDGSVTINKTFSFAIAKTGATGGTGPAGRGISSTTIEYQVGTSGTTVPTGTWSTSPVATTTQGQYLWTRTTIKYTSGSDSVSYSVAAHGSTGGTGPTGRGISSTTIEYQVGTSGTSAPTGTWSTSPVATTTQGQYLWTRTTIKYTSGSDSISYSVAAHGTKGSQGNPGVDAILISITTSNGNIFKNNTGSTVLTAHVYMRDETGYALVYQEFECTSYMHEDSDSISVLIPPAVAIMDILDSDGDSVLDQGVYASIVSSGTRIEIEMNQSHAGQVWTAVYRSSGEAKYYTLGKRTDSVNKGAFSVGLGYNVESTGNASISEGYGTAARSKGAHAEGINTVARLGDAAHAEGVGTVATGRGSHAEVVDTLAAGGHAQGKGTISNALSQAAMGQYNVRSVGWYDISTLTPKHLLLIGNGSSDTNRSNALSLDFGGNLITQGMAGMIQMFAAATPPEGWLICDGSAVSRTTYAKLFSVIGTTWGTGDGSTTFNLPDLRGRAPIGAGTGRNVANTANLATRTLGTKVSDSESVTLATANMPNHRHPAAPSGGRFLTQPGTTGVGTVRVAAASSGSNYVPKSSTNVDFAGADYTGYTPGSSATPHYNMQPSTVVNFIICTGKTS